MRTTQARAVVGAMLAALICAGGWRWAAVVAPTGAPAADERQPAERIRVEVGACVIEAPLALRVHLEALAERAPSILPRIESSLGVRPAAPYRILLIPPGWSGDPEIAARMVEIIDL